MARSCTSRRVHQRLAAGLLLLLLACACPLEAAASTQTAEETTPSPSITLPWHSCSPLSDDPSESDSLFRPIGVMSSSEHVVPGETVGLVIVGSLIHNLTSGAFAWHVESKREVSAGSVSIDERFGRLTELLSTPLPLVASESVQLAFPWSVPAAGNFTEQDHALSIRLQMMDEQLRPLLCVTFSLPLSVEEPVPTADSTNQALGYTTAVISSICFGLYFVPVKQFDSGDGMFFQWLLSLGVWLGGLIVQLVRGSVFEPLAMVGGVLWYTSVLMAVPAIQLIGMGVGFSLCCISCLVVGWASGKFGWLVNKQLVEDEALNYCGIVIICIGMTLLAFVKSTGRNTNPDKYDRLELNGQGGAPSRSGDLVGRDSPDVMLSHTDKVKKIAHSQQAHWSDALSPKAKHFLGVCFTLGSGLCAGFDMTPSQYLIDSGKGSSQQGIDYCFSFFCGILVSSTLTFILYSSLKRNQPQVFGHLVLPSILGGLCWATAQILWFFANDEIGFVGTFPIVSSVPALVSCLLGAMVYQEVQGRRNFALLSVAFLLTLVGVLMIAFSLPSDA